MVQTDSKVQDWDCMEGVVTLSSHIYSTVLSVVRRVICGGELSCKISDFFLKWKNSLNMTSSHLQHFMWWLAFTVFPNSKVEEESQPSDIKKMEAITFPVDGVLLNFFF